MKTRPLQVAQEINRVIAESLSIESRNPVFSSVSITEVKITDDLSYAKIFFSHWQGDIESSDLCHDLNHAVPWLQKQIAKKLRLRRIPKLQFLVDPVPAQASHIECLLRQTR